MNTIFEDFLIREVNSFQDAILKMTSTRKGLLFVVDANHNLLGVIADGEIRRGLLSKVGLNSPVTKIMNLNPVLSKNDGQAVDILKKNTHLLAIPVLNELNQIHQIALIDNKEIEVIHKEEKSVSNNDEKVEVLTIIPARGGSKRIPKKNLAKVGDESLLAKAILVAQKIEMSNHITVSTDDVEIAEEARKYGVKVPWLRPASLAEDNSKSIDVIIHAIQTFEQNHGYRPKYGLLLEPTSPLRTSYIINDAIKIFKESNADSMASVNDLRHNFHPEEILKRKGNQLVPFLDDRTMCNRKLRGEQEQLYVLNGLLYLFSIDTLLDTKCLYGNNCLIYETNPELFLDIDTMADLKLAQIKNKQNY